MKYILIFILLISGVSYGQTKYYIRADSVVIQKVGSNGELIIENSTRSVTGGVLTNIGNGRTSFVTPSAGATPTWQQTLTAGSTLTGNNTITGGAFDFTWNNAGGWLINSVDDIQLTSTQSGYSNYIAAATGGAEISSTLAGRGSQISVLGDTAYISPSLGNLKIDSLNYTLSTTRKKILLRDTTTGLVENIDPALLSGTNIYNTDGTLTGNRIVTTGTDYLKITGSNTTFTEGVLNVTNTGSGVDASAIYADASTGGNGILGYGFITGVQGVSNGSTGVGVGVRGVATGAKTTNNGGVFYASGATFNNAITLGNGSGTANKILMNGPTSGAVGIQTAAAAGTYTLTLPADDGDNLDVLQTNGSGVLDWVPMSGGSGLTVGTTTITSGTDTRVPFNDAGVYNEDVGFVYNKTTDILSTINGFASTNTGIVAYSLGDGSAIRVPLNNGTMYIDAGGNLLGTINLRAASTTVSGTLTLKGYTVATLPAGTVGMTAYVTDATAPTYLGALVGGGGVTCPVFYNGAAWVSH